MNAVELLHDKKNYYIITDLIEGGELFDLIKKTHKSGEKNGAYIIKQVL